MVRISCHSPFRHYEMFHNKDCGSSFGGSIFNNTYNFNCSGNCGGGGSFWSGFGLGFGNVLGNMFGGLCGGLFGGLGNMFGGFGGGFGNMFGGFGFGNMFGGFGGFGNMFGGFGFGNMFGGFGFGNMFGGLGFGGWGNMFSTPASTTPEAQTTTTPETKNSNKESKTESDTTLSSIKSANSLKDLNGITPNTQTEINAFADKFNELAEGADDSELKNAYENLSDELKDKVGTKLSSNIKDKLNKQEEDITTQIENAKDLDALTKIKIKSDTDQKAFIKRFTELAESATSEQITQALSGLTDPLKSQVVNALKAKVGQDTNSAIQTALEALENPDSNPKILQEEKQEVPREVDASQENDEDTTEIDQDMSNQENNRHIDNVPDVSQLLRITYKELNQSEQEEYLNKIRTLTQDYEPNQWQTLLAGLDNQPDLRKAIKEKLFYNGRTNYDGTSPVSTLKSVIDEGYENGNINNILPVTQNTGKPPKNFTATTSAGIVVTYTLVEDSPNDDGEYIYQSNRRGQKYILQKDGDSDYVLIQYPYNEGYGSPDAY